MSALPFFVVYAMPLALLLGVGLLGASGWWLVPVLVFGLIPVLDVLSGHDRDDASDDEVARREANPLFNLALRLWVPTQLACLGFAMWTVHRGASVLEILGLAVAVGILTGGGGINIAHELMHRTHKGDRALAELLMASVTYTWFCVEHVLGHHRNVATPEDAASSRFGETLYAYLPRTLTQGFFSFWRLERARCERRKIRWTSWQDRRTRYLLGLAALYLALALLGGPKVLLFFFAQSAVAVTLLEIINYVEHYGLERQRRPDGSYERVSPRHSWNGHQRLTGYFLFHLPRHADHHAYASRPYWKLRAWVDAPTLPLGYPTMVLIALVPPLWFRIMNPRVRALAAG